MEERTSGQSRWFPRPRWRTEVALHRYGGISPPAHDARAEEIPRISRGSGGQLPRRLPAFAGAYRDRRDDEGGLVPPSPVRLGREVRGVGLEEQALRGHAPE